MTSQAVRLEGKLKHRPVGVTRSGFHRRKDSMHP